jgi:hypothetical protein
MHMPLTHGCCAPLQLLSIGLPSCHPSVSCEHVDVMAGHGAHVVAAACAAQQLYVDAPDATCVGPVMAVASVLHVVVHMEHVMAEVVLRLVG